MTAFFAKYDYKLAALFGALTMIFVLAMTNSSFFNWAFERHHNLLSWYIRPLFLIPFGYFAYQHSLAGIFATIFLLLTSMFWFPKPAAVDDSVIVFLQMEQDYLSGEWTMLKIGLMALIPISLWALAAALWKRSLFFGISVVIFMAVGKVFWSVVEAGHSGLSILAPAVVGLALCAGLLTIGFRRLEQKAREIGSFGPLGPPFL